jgi:hypothetical protein
MLMMRTNEALFRSACSWRVGQGQQLSSRKTMTGGGKEGGNDEDDDDDDDDDDDER